MTTHSGLQRLALSYAYLCMCIHAFAVTVIRLVFNYIPVIKTNLPLVVLRVRIIVKQIISNMFK